MADKFSSLCSSSVPLRAGESITGDRVEEAIMTFSLTTPSPPSHGDWSHHTGVININ